jgi:hypothetical protein
VGRVSVQLEGSRFESNPGDLVTFFSERGRPSRVLNRRLPRITARDVLLIAAFGGYSFAQRTDRPITR